MSTDTRQLVRARGKASGAHQKDAIRHVLCLGQREQGGADVTKFQNDAEPLAKVLQMTPGNIQTIIIAELWKEANSERTKATTKLAQRLIQRTIDGDAVLQRHTLAWLA